VAGNEVAEVAGAADVVAATVVSVLVDGAGGVVGAPVP
jgi:hypothetical protein